MLRDPRPKIRTPWRRVAASVALVLCLWAMIPAAARAAPDAGDIPAFTFSVVKAWPHDRGAFTEGLVYHDGVLIESTGLYGRSALRKVDLETGAIRQEVKLPDKYFGEGIAVLGEKIFQLTWQSHRGFVYGLESMKLEGEFPFEGEGWGLTTDGTSLVMTDGTSRIRFIDPATFKVTRTIEVLAHGQPVTSLNELEYVNGELYANVWQTQFILRIDPATGRILGTIDFVGILPRAEFARDTDVMNGIAYDAKADRLFVTGKGWPKLFEVKIKPK